MIRICLALFVIICGIQSIDCVLCQRWCPPCLEGECTYGKEFEYCECCEKCLQGPDEMCGGQNGTFGKCAPDYFCEKQFPSAKEITNPKGVCKKIKLANCLSPCDVPTCETSKICERGTGKDYCGCCDICLQDHREPCGGMNGKFGICGRGLYCDERGGSPGMCQPWFLDPKRPHVG